MQGFRGTADFLVRIDHGSAGDGSSSYGYQVWDAKLSKQAKPSHVLQLCAYQEMVERLWPPPERKPDALLSNSSMADVTAGSTPSKSEEVSLASLSTMRVAELKSQLRLLGLPLSGNKAALVDRLVTASKAQEADIWSAEQVRLPRHLSASSTGAGARTAVAASCAPRACLVIDGATTILPVDLAPYQAFFRRLRQR